MLNYYLLMWNSLFSKKKTFSYLCHCVQHEKHKPKIKSKNVKEKKNLEMTTYTNYGFEYIYIQTISIESTKEFSNDLEVFMYHVGCTLFTHESGKKSCFYQSVKKFAYSKIIWKHLVNRNKPKRLRVFLNFFLTF